MVVNETTSFRCFETLPNYDFHAFKDLVPKCQQLAFSRDRVMSNANIQKLQIICSIFTCQKSAYERKIRGQKKTRKFARNKKERKRINKFPSERDNETGYQDVANTIFNDNKPGNRVGN